MATTLERPPLERPPVEGGRGRTLWAVPAALLLGLTLAVWLASDVSLPHALTFLGYELAFVFVPGVLAYTALTRRSEFDLRHVLVGWALGYALELGAFAATAAAGARTAFDFYPLAMVAVTAPFVWPLVRERFSRARESVPGPRSIPGWVWALAGLLAFALLDIGFELYPLYKLPWHLSNHGFYYPFDWEMANSIAAEAKQHWPLMAPNVVGVPVSYHYFAFLHMAAIGQVTHLDMFLINFRLVTIPMLFLATLLAFELGRRLSDGSAWVGVGTAFLVLFVANPSVLSVLFCAVVLGLVLLGRRTSLRTAAIAGGGIAVILALTYHRWKTGLTHPVSGKYTLWSNVFDTPSFALGEVLFLAVAIELCDRLQSRLRVLARPGTWVVIVALMAASTGAKAAAPAVLVPGLALGIAYCWRFDRGSVRTLGAALAAAVGTLALSWLVVFNSGPQDEIRLEPGGSARGLVPHLSHHLFDKPTGPAKLFFFGVASLIALLYLLAPLAPGLWVEMKSRAWRPSASQAWLLGTLLAGIGMALAFTAGGNAQFWFYYFGYTGGAAVAVMGFAALWRRHVSARGSAWAVAGVLVAIVAFLSVATIAPSRFVRAVAKGPVYSPPAAQSFYVTRDLYTGLRWLRAHSTSNDVLAVNTPFNPRACYYAAFTERRFVLECTFPETVRGDLETWPRTYPDRFAINEGIFRRGDPAALRTAVRRFGVDYLIVDLVAGHGGSPAMASRVERLAPLVYRNRAVAIFHIPR